MKKSIYGKNCLFMVLLMISVLIITGCTSSPNDKNTPVVAEKSLATNKTEVNALVIYHWWTSSGESAAIGSLVDEFSKEYPDVAIMPAPVKSSGIDFHEKVLKPMVLNGEAPDSFQGHPGYEIKPYYDSNTLETVDDIWASSNLESVTPKIIQDINKFKGHYYSIPIDVHRGNVIWYNKQLLDKNGIDASTLKDWDSFFNACDKLKASGVKYPIRMGEGWTAGEVLENIIASEGPKFYEDWINGKVTSANDPKLLHALETFKKFLSYTNNDSATTGWNDAVGSVISGDSAFNLMGDWANGEFKIVGMKYGIDYGTFPVPGTSDEYITDVDTFVRPKGAAHPANSVKWLNLVASKAGQDAFNPKKGSISVRSDSDISLYDDYQKSAIADFKAVHYYLPSRGTGMPNSVVVPFNNVIVPEFVRDKDITKTAEDVTKLIKKSSADFITTWSLT